ncbi:MAG: hypothetical protein V7L14_09405 [Nostoc sp.]|uniref:hypothetical protein n=1 Tax=Nostoc sp. TaxID=1180 RepID=UPI002FFC96AB
MWGLPPLDLRQSRNEVHFQPEAGNEVLKGFGLKLTRMSNAVPLREIYMYQGLCEMVLPSEIVWL